MKKNQAVPLIRFEHFSFQYRAQKKPTLVDINLSIYPGEKILIIGASGSGKTTLAHCINGLIPFNYRGESTGHLWVGGEETKNSSIFALSKTVGTVLQDPDGQFVGLTAAEDIAFSLENNCVPQPEMLERVQQAAGTVGIADHLHRSPYDLSGGQKQRVSMAGVMIDRVRILLFDEPLANLDPATGKQAIELIDSIMTNDKTTILIIEHRLEDVLHRGVDRIVLLDEGHVIADMPPDDLLCGDWLEKSGIRKPLYITAMKYAGIRVTPEKRPAGIGTLILGEEDRASLQKWLPAAAPAHAERQKPELLTIENLHFAYTTGEPALMDISFSVREGEMPAIVGANGAGKSTLAKLICGFESPDAGRLLLGGVDMASYSIAERAAHVGYVMQNPKQMISKTKLFDEVAMGLVTRGMDEETTRCRVEETLKVCGLYPFRHWPISALSFGQKKRVTIASVLVMEPKLIILDEPTAGQDYRHYTDIMEFLVSLNQRGMTVVMITHDMHLMLEYASRTLVFSGGELLADSTAAQVLTDPDLIRRASLKETSLFALAQNAGIGSAAGLAQRFIDYERRAKTGG